MKDVVLDMVKRICSKSWFRWVIASFLLIITFVLMFLFLPFTHFEEGERFIYVYPNSTNAYERMVKQVDSSHILKSTFIFNTAARLLHLDKTLMVGRFRVARRASLFTILSTLLSHAQTPLKLVINKVRTEDELLELLQKKIPLDSSLFLSVFHQKAREYLGIENNDQALTMLIPNTYEVYWTSSPEVIIEKWFDAYKRFWDSTRMQKAAAKKMTPTQIYILASIVEEETNKTSDKLLISSVYINRLRIKMHLGSCPTIKYALKDFALRRVLNHHLQVVSPYNTYTHEGLPPGPICTPSTKTIDAVLDAPTTNYLYFVASSLLNNTHEFSSNYSEHVNKAIKYQHAINELGIFN